MAKYWVDLMTEKEYWSEEEVRAEVFGTVPDMELLGTILNKMEVEEVIQELFRLNSPLYYKIVDMAKQLRWKEVIIECEETIDYYEEDEEDDE